MTFTGEFDFDQIILNCRHLSEFWVIDHSTTTSEAASPTGGQSGMGGDFLYRWGNPQAYRAGASANQKLFVQHDAHWIENGLPGAGNILVFNNGNGRPESYFLTIDELIPPVDDLGYYQLPIQGQPFGPDSAAWRYQADTPDSFYSSFISGSQRLQNNNTLICSGGHGKLFEVISSGEVVWEFISPVNISVVMPTKIIQLTYPMQFIS